MTLAARLSIFLLFGALLLGCTTSVEGESDDDLFDRYGVVIGPARRQTVLTGFLLGGEVAELAVVHVDKDGDPLLRIHAFDGDTWVPSLEATLGSEVGFIDVASPGGSERLITYEPGRLSRFDPETGTGQDLVAVTSSFEPPRENEIPHVDITRDVNGDGRDDLVVPDVDGFWVLVQIEGDAFAEPVKIGPPAELSRILGADGYRYDPWRWSTPASTRNASLHSSRPRCRGSGSSRSIAACGLPT
ncbi:MAG: hypothetical protein GY711_20910 [bacterium]|nr:hypothetical protein [bacterium]